MELGELSSDDLHYILTHVSLPPKLPQSSDKSSPFERSLCNVIYHCAIAYEKLLPQNKKPRWEQVVRLLGNIAKLHAFDVFFPDAIQCSMSRMETGGK